MTAAEEKWGDTVKKMLFIFNPRAGKLKANKLLADILSEFSASEYDVHVYVTQRPDDGRIAVRERGKNADLIVCCGGDGTFNETVAGLLEGGLNVPVGYIPAGSTNDFAGSLKLSDKPLDAAKEILNGVPCPYDVGLFADRYFTYVASFGAFTRASYDTPQDVKNALGHSAYLLSGLRDLPQIHGEHMRVILDGEEVLEDDYIFGAICNTTSLGGVMSLDPDQVDMGDGRFEVILVRAPKNLGELAECISAVHQKKYNCGMVAFRSASHVVVEGENPQTWSLDGERADGPARVEIQNVHHAIQLMQKEKS